MRRRPDLLIVEAELYSKKDWMDLKYPWENHESDLSNEKRPGYLPYIGDYT